jgi:hypothetical protein
MPKVTPSKDKTQRTLRTENEMNVMKNMEAIFLAAVFLAGVTNVATAASEHARERALAQVSAEGKQMLVVKVSAKRLTAAEKAAL